MITAYTDGACRVSNPGLCSASFVVYKDNAKYHEQGRVLEGRHTNNESEYTALLDLLEWLYAQSIRNVVIHSDSKLVVNQTLHNWECNGLLRPLRDKAYGLFINGCHILKHVKGHEGNVGNEAADALCNALLDKYQGGV